MIHAGLLYLQHTFACSDEALIWTWVENPYWQHFCGEIYFQHEPPIDPSSRLRISECGESAAPVVRHAEWPIGPMPLI